MIHVRPEPAGGRDLVHACLLGSWAAAPNGGRWQVGRPVPSVRLSAASAAKPSIVRRARTVGWRYPLLSGKAQGLAYVLAQKKGLVFAGINGPVLTRRLFAAAELAERMVSEDQTMYEPRLLEAPALRLFALWFFASHGKSRFVVLKPSLDDIAVLTDEAGIQGHIETALSRLHPERS